MPFFYGEKMVTSEKILELLQTAESADIFDKAVVGYLLPDGSSHIVTLNTPEDTVFDIASLTKVCPTSTLALTYVLEGQLSIDAKVIDYIPELQTNYRDEIYVSHLLTHSLDYRVPMKTLTALSPEEILNVLYTYEFAAAPGTVFNYGNPASVLLGILLQRLTGKTLQEQGNERFFTPLGMTRSGYDPLTRVPKSEIAATELCEFRHREIQGEVHDESAWVLQKLFPVGSAGMFSCVPDLLKFVKMILMDGKFEDKQIIPAGILDIVSHNAFPDNFGACAALGWELNAPRFMGTKVSPQAFGKTGFTGASIVADPDKGGAIVMLSNFTYPHREPNADRIHAFRATLADAFFGEIE